MMPLELFARMAAQRNGLDEALVCAVVEQESDWNTWAIRAEPEFDVRYEKPLHLVATEEWTRSMSWGLMQLMGETARERGFTDAIPELLDPGTGLQWGCVQLKAMLHLAAGDIKKALLFYNGGKNKQYPDEVLARKPKYEGVST